MYQRKVDVDMLNALKSVLRRSAFPDPPYVDTLYILPPRRRRPKLVHTGTSIPLYLVSARLASACVFLCLNVSVCLSNRLFPSSSTNI